uniref:Uncharacterized protein n=1 Tax=Cannabis sativa TaxID=3483 RepID=A0A803Q808_CANSA
MNEGREEDVPPREGRSRSHHGESYSNVDGATSHPIGERTNQRTHNNIGRNTDVHPWNAQTRPNPSPKDFVFDRVGLSVGKDLWNNLNRRCNNRDEYMLHQNNPPKAQGRPNSVDPYVQPPINP